MVYYIFKSPLTRKKNHLHGAFLEVIMDKLPTLASHYCKHFVAGSKRFIRRRMGSKNSIMVFKNHIGFKYLCDNWQSKDKVFVLKLSMDLVESGLDQLSACRVIKIWNIVDHVWPCKVPLQLNYTIHIMDICSFGGAWMYMLFLLICQSR
jgi:hypothetical protein